MTMGEKKMYYIEIERGGKRQTDISTERTRGERRGRENAIGRDSDRETGRRAK